MTSTVSCVMLLLIHALTSTAVKTTVEVVAWVNNYPNFLLHSIVLSGCDYNPGPNLDDGLANPCF